jgi:hypothetical protein
VRTAAVAVAKVKNEVRLWSRPEIVSNLILIIYSN